jgi:hypothetical protein
VNLIGGRWCAALDGRTYMRPNPAHPDDVVGHFPDQAPFGGWNQSRGPFPEAGQTALDFFTRRKTIAFSAP